MLHQGKACSFEFEPNGARHGKPVSELTLLGWMASPRNQAELSQAFASFTQPDTPSTSSNSSKLAKRSFMICSEIDQCVTEDGVEVMGYCNWLSYQGQAHLWELCNYCSGEPASDPQILNLDQSYLSEYTDVPQEAKKPPEKLYSVFSCEAYLPKLAVPSNINQRSLVYHCFRVLAIGLTAHLKRQRAGSSRSVLEDSGWRLDRSKRYFAGLQTLRHASSGSLRPSTGPSVRSKLSCRRRLQRRKRRCDEKKKPPWNCRLRCLLSDGSYSRMRRASRICGQTSRTTAQRSNPHIRRCWSSGRRHKSTCKMRSSAWKLPAAFTSSMLWSLASAGTWSRNRWKGTLPLVRKLGLSRSRSLDPRSPQMHYGRRLRPVAVLSLAKAKRI
eukprot:s1473_g4.t1